MSGTGSGNSSESLYGEQRIELFEFPPDGFDPLHADDHELFLYGYPARPDRQMHAELYEHWRQLFSQPMTVIQPKFGNPIGRAFGGITEHPWSGSVWLENGSPFKFVSGNWTVPNTAISRLVEGSHTYECSTWVGIDGYTDMVHNPVQAGTYQAISVNYSLHFPLIFSVSHSTWAWVDWEPVGARPITNFPVSGGDVIYCALTVLSPTQVAVYMWNVTTSLYTSCRMSAPTPQDEHQVWGQTAEWILECPHKEGDPPVYLPRFGKVYFDKCIAYTQDNTVFSGPNGTLLPLKDIRGSTVSLPVKVTDDLFVIYYTDNTPDE